MGSTIAVYESKYRIAVCHTAENGDLLEDISIQLGRNCTLMQTSSLLLSLTKLYLSLGKKACFQPFSTSHMFTDPFMVGS